MIPETQSSATVKPSPNQPGSLGEQLATLITALHLGERRGTTAAEQWTEARQRCMVHARKVTR